MLNRFHLVAAFGVTPEAFARALETNGREVGRWRVSTSGGVSARDTSILDHRLGLLSRATGALVLRASAHEKCAVVSVQRDGRYRALFDHRHGGLRRDLRDAFFARPEVLAEGREPEPETVALDIAVAPERRAALTVGDDEILARLDAGETPRAAWERVIQDRARRLAVELEAAGVEGVDAAHLEAVLGGAASAIDLPSSLPPALGDLPELLEAMGLAGIRAQLAADSWESEPGVDASEAPRDAAAEAAADTPEEVATEVPLDLSSEGGVDGGASRKPRSRRARVPLLVSLVLGGGALLGAWFGRSSGTLSTLSGAALGCALPLLLAVVAFLAWLLFGALRIWAFSAWSRRHAPPPGARAQWARRLPPESTGPARRAIALWTELAHELDPDPARVAIPATRLYPDVFLPVGRGSRELLACLERPGEAETLADALAELRLELLDRKLAGQPTAELRPRFLERMRAG